MTILWILEIITPKKILSHEEKLFWNSITKYLSFFFYEYFFFSCLIDCYSNFVSLRAQYFNNIACISVFDTLNLCSFLDNCENEKCIRNGILRRGKYLESRNKTYKLNLRKNGNLVLTCEERPIWTSFTSNNNVDFLYLDEEGTSLILRGKNNSTVWRAHSKWLGKKLILQDDGRLVLYNSCNTSIWEIGKNKKCPKGLCNLLNA